MSISKLFIINYSLFIKLRFPILPDLQIAVVLDRDLDSIDKIGAFVFGLDTFRGKLGFIGDPRDRTGVFPAIIPIVGEDLERLP